MSRSPVLIQYLYAVRGCVKIEISFHFVILNVVKDLETQADAHEILHFVPLDIAF